jgi:hypothetical protein
MSEYTKIDPILSKDNSVNEETVREKVVPGDGKAAAVEGEPTPAGTLGTRVAVKVME